MNCQAVRNKILALPDPRHVPEPLRAHVAGCGACRAWAEQAARLEGLLERLPTPPAPADKKAALIEQLSRGPVAEPAAPRRGPLREWLQRNATVIGGLAAALLLAVGWWVAVRDDQIAVAPPAAPKDPFLAKVVERDVALANADTPAKKLRVLGGLADDIATEARGLARIATPEELKDVAHWYDRVVNHGLVKQAKDISDGVALLPAERKAEFEELARKLGDTAEEVKKLTGEVPPGAKPILERIAGTARDGQKTLTELAGKV